MLRSLMVLTWMLWAPLAGAKGLTGTFPSIDGGTLAIEQWRGQPVLVVNTASQCGYTGQYAGLQALYDRYRDQGLVVLAIPSDDFNQELGSAAEVKEFCEMTFGLDLPMTDITRIKGRMAHPFYRALRRQAGFVPQWNFNKVLLSAEGEVIATWGSRTRPQSTQIIEAVENALN